MSREGLAKDGDLLQQLCPGVAVRDQVYPKGWVKRKCSRTKVCFENSGNVFISLVFKLIHFLFRF